MITIVWEYQVKANYVTEFERIYAPDGGWAKLFQRCEGFIDTVLIHSTDHPELYLTHDHWKSLKDYKLFLSKWKEEYEKLDKQCEDLTEHESCLGTFGVGFNDEESI